MSIVGNINELKLYLDNLFPVQIKVVQLDKLPHNFLPYHFSNPPPQVFDSISEEELEKLALEIAGYFFSNANQTEFSFFSRSSISEFSEPGWLLHFAKMNISEAGLPKEVAFFTYNLNLFGDVKTKLYRALENEEFYKANLNRVSSLTKKEKEIIGLLTTGMNSAEIAEATFTSVNTVLTHRKNILRKLNNPGFAGLMRFAEVFDLTTNNSIYYETIIKQRNPGNQQSTSIYP